ncbi:hypothetical protein GCM10010967_23310 [Dyadobacter beijingensis]|uniref:Beta-galactosidase trimerisation domain-containing protein n=1 Tax=Dyadobacter beijingensis TaxID=365489 RepID=A0ABQ2HU27_9BACT|nr:hypothetical protein [Dyadobacter beijingensis]GGM89773.1 hypothetical protein GCM10010967_23310 [Dyadobacter beijingensis]
MKLKLALSCLSLLASVSLSAQNKLGTLKGKNFNNITLEVSLKPFKKNDKAYIREVAREMFMQWSSMLRHADTVSVMLWTSDGSEILDYKGTPTQPLEWAKYMGNPNTEHAVNSGPKELSIHERAYLYLDNPPAFTYGDLKFIVQTLKEEGRKATGKPVLVGETFDPGPEFAKSDFKYKKHREILGGSAMGHNTMVSCYSVLNADSEAYAGFPKGIPANTRFGTFLGRQSRHFLKDMGFDFLWLSNGFGYGVEGWSSTGAIFDGKGFDQAKLADTKDKIAGFWKYFRAENPDVQIQTRGTNLSTGTDLARDGVNLEAIYRDKNMLPPPNSPWAALDGDFGLEMVGYMSRMAELPDERFLFRFYTHDPWWLNSPWLDRYGREAHDIYLPMSVSRINAKGEVKIPSHLSFLSIDDTHGDMPTQVPDEVTPHILKARYDAPTAPGPLVWVYPFEEYHRWAFAYKDRLPEIYYGDWLIRQAINNGLPLNTVVSTNAFQSVLKSKPGFFKESILVSVVPDADSPLERALIGFVKNGGKLMVYGPAGHAGKAFLELLNLKNGTPLEGEFKISGQYEGDRLNTAYPNVVRHEALFSGGGIATNLANPNDPNTRLMATVTPAGQVPAGQVPAGQARDVAWVRTGNDWNGGKVVYIRGTNSSKFNGGKLLNPDDPSKFFTGPLLMRYALAAFDMHCVIEKENPAVKSPVLTIARSHNAFIFSGYHPNSTITDRFKFPQGAPLLLGLETKLDAGHSVYNLPTAWNRECRIFVTQNEGIVSYKELHSGVKDIDKRFQVSGLEGATVRVYAPEHISLEKFEAYINAAYPWKTGRIKVSEGDPKLGRHFVAEHVTGTLTVAW